MELLSRSWFLLTAVVLAGIASTDAWSAPKIDNDAEEDKPYILEKIKSYLIDEESSEKSSMDEGSSEKSSVDEGSSEKSSVDEGSSEKSSVDEGSSEKSNVDEGSSESNSKDEGDDEELGML